MERLAINERISAAREHLRAAGKGRGEEVAPRNAMLGVDLLMPRVKQAYANLIRAVRRGRRSRAEIAICA